jgi:hypothetical protein
MKRMRFSLRTLFIVVAIVALAMAWVEPNLRWKRDRESAGVSEGYPDFISIVARETLHRRTTETLPWGLRLFGARPVPVLHFHSGVPATTKSVEELQRLFPEADIIEIWYPTFPAE